MTKHYIKIVTKSHAGTVARLLSLFSSRGISIDTINSGDEINTPYSRVVLSISTKKAQLKIICHQIERLYDTISVTLYEEGALEVETMLIKVKSEGILLEKLKPILIAETVEIMQQDNNTIIFAKVGTSEQLDKTYKALDAFDILEVIRTGSTVIAK